MADRVKDYSAWLKKQSDAESLKTILSYDDSDDVIDFWLHPLGEGAENFPTELVVEAKALAFVLGGTKKITPTTWSPQLRTQVAQGIADALRGAQVADAEEDEAS